MAKIKDVAEAAGVSPSTVSRVLCNGPVSDKVRKRVEEAMRQLDYRPNLAARRLRSQHTDTIGLIVSDIRNPFFTAVSRAVEDEAYRNGMRVILCNTDENPDKEAMYLRLMQEERVTGVIFAEMQASNAGLGYLLSDAAALYNTPRVFVLIVIVTVLAVVLVEVVDTIERVFFKKHCRNSNVKSNI